MDSGQWTAGNSLFAVHCQLSTPFRDCLKTYYLSPRNLSKRTCWEMAISKANENGWPVLGYRAACIFLEGVPLAMRVKSRQGEDAYVAKCEPSITRRLWHAAFQ